MLENALKRAQMLAKKLRNVGTRAVEYAVRVLVCLAFLKDALKALLQHVLCVRGLTG